MRAAEPAWCRTPNVHLVESENLGMRVDAAINYYGKPYQTLLAIETLLEHSGEHIDRIFLIREREQPRPDDPLPALVERYGDRVVLWTPPRYRGYEETSFDTLAHDRDDRLSTRYQYALEETDKPYLFISHNDMEYTGDIVGALLDKMREGSYAGVGLIGQCWNCPASYAGACDGSRWGQVRIGYLHAVWLALRHRSPRTTARGISRRRAWPLPECRLNEFACLLDVAAYRRETVPVGTTLPFGSFGGGLDTGTGWFRSMVHKGYEFGYVDIWAYGRHADGQGHQDLFDAARFESKEAAAAEKLRLRGVL